MATQIRFQTAEDVVQRLAEIDHEVMRLGSPQVASELTKLLGGRIVACIGGVNSARSVRQWIEDECAPQRLESLRVGLRLARLIEEAEEDAKVAQAWFIGAKPRLGNKSPAILLADNNPDTVVGPLYSEAINFILN